ncbi:MAG: winged helix-turn-helix transcriptional regulator [Candidatus Micrarchaeaceae archaeon]
MLNRMEMRVLRELCGNSRISASELSRKLGISRYIASKNVEALEAKLGLRYTLELNYRLLGFPSMHAIYINFARKPKPGALSKLIAGSSRIQLFATARGDFDALALALAKNPVEYSQLEVALQFSLMSYGAEVHSAEVTLMRFGFVPIGNALLAAASGIDDDTKRLLMALNENSRQGLGAISKAIGMDAEMVRYYMKKLEKAGIIKRYTAIMTNGVPKSRIAAFINYHVTSGIEERIAMERRRLYFAEPDEPYAANSLQEMWSISGAAQAFLLACFDSESACEAMISEHNRIYRKDRPAVTKAFIDNVLLGFLPFRNMDVKSSYDTTGWPLDLL